MFPQVSSVFFNWTDAIQMKVIKKEAVDFELFEGTLAVVEFEAVIQAMKSKDVDRKPENERIWKWWNMWSTENFPSDTVVQDPDGVQFRIQRTTDWSRGGFYVAEMTEQPRGM